MNRRIVMFGPAALALALSACESSVSPVAEGPVGLTQGRAEARAGAGPSEGEGNGLAALEGEALKLVSALIEEVDALGRIGALTRGRAVSLQRHLTTADRRIRDRRYDLAFPPLRTFQDRVTRFTRQGVLGASQAEPLLDGVEDLISDLLVRFFTCPDPAEIEANLRESAEDEEVRPEIDLDIRAREERFVIDRPVTLLAALEEAGRPLPGAEVEAYIRVPAGYCVAFPLLDDGFAPDAAAADGVYTMAFTSPRDPGRYLAYVTATGHDRGQEAFVRARLLSFFVVRAPDTSQPSGGDGLPQLLLDHPFPPRLFGNPVLPGFLR